MDDGDRRFTIEFNRYWDNDVLSLKNANKKKTTQKTFNTVLKVSAIQTIKIF